MAASGTFRVDIHWDQNAIRNFMQLNNNLGELHDFRDAWDEVTQIMKNSIKRNIQFGVFPEGHIKAGGPWPMLRGYYAKKVGRLRMFIEPWSPIYDAYINAPLVRRYVDHLDYMPSPLRMAGDDAPFPFYDLALRHGFFAQGWAKGVYVKGRDWFGMDKQGEGYLDLIMARRVPKKMQKGLTQSTLGMF